MAISAEKGYVKPSVYQGQYNLFARGLEARLFPTLRKFNMSFVHSGKPSILPTSSLMTNECSPLAGDFLTGKLTHSTSSDEFISTRFEISDGNRVGKCFRRWYDKDSMHQAIEKLKEICDAHPVSPEEASLRWIVYHSALKGGDGVILGASKVSQVRSDIAAKEWAVEWEAVERAGGFTENRGG